MKFKKGGVNCSNSNFISIEFEYQNSGSSHNEMGQVHFFFVLLISNLSNGFDWYNGKSGSLVIQEAAYDYE